MSEQKNIAGLVTGLVALLATACFFILGFLTGSWDIVWMVFLAIPVAGIIGDMIVKRKDRMAAVTGLVAVIAAMVFLILGLTLHIWHLAWLVFLSIPISGMILDAIIKKNDFSGAIVGIVAMLAVAAFFLLGFFLHIWHIAWVVFLLVPITAVIIEICKAASKSKTMPGGGPDSGNP